MEDAPATAEKAIPESSAVADTGDVKAGGGGGGGKKKKKNKK